MRKNNRLVIRKPHQIAWAITESRELIEEEMDKAKNRMLAGKTDPPAMLQEGLNSDKKQHVIDKSYYQKKGHEGEALQEVAKHFQGQVSAFLLI